MTLGWGRSENACHPLIHAKRELVPLSSNHDNGIHYQDQQLSDSEHETRFHYHLDARRLSPWGVPPRPTSLNYYGSRRKPSVINGMADHVPII